MRFLVSRLNHSAKMSITLVSVTCAHFILRGPIQSQQILPNAEKVDDYDAETCEHNGPEGVSLNHDNFD